jgi:two-component system, sensor histidine kinase LadS
MHCQKKFRIYALALLVVFMLAGFAVRPASWFGEPAQAKANDQARFSEAKPAVLTDGQGEYPLGLQLDILEDPGGDLTIEDVSSAEYEGKYFPSQSPAPNFGYTLSAYWVRFHLDNQTHQTNEWLLEIGYVYTQYVDFYYPSSEPPGYAVKKTGALRPVSTRDIPFPRFIFNLSLPAGSQQTYYLRFKNEGSMTLPLTLWSKDTF